jgi:multicomponent Na+:H+ antiporter subunit E
MMRALLVAWLTVLWLVLWRDASAANVVSGVAIALVVLLVFPPRQVTGEHALRPVKLLVFIGYFAWKLVVSNLIVAREIVTPRDHVRSGIVAVPVEACSDLVITLVANAISLTPGTLTLEVRRDPPVLFVHVLHLHDLDQVRRDIRTLQRLTVEAIGSAEAVAELDAEPPPHVEDHAR